MKTTKMLLLSLSGCILVAGYATLLVKLPPPPPPVSLNYCPHMKVCPVLSGKLWP